MQLSNARQREIRSLQTRAGRRKSGKTIVEGIRALQTMLQCNRHPQYLVICDERLTTAGRKSLSQLDFGDAAIYKCEAKVFAKLSSTVHSQGVVAVVEHCQCRPQVENLVGKARFIVYLDGVRDPGNLGAIIRTAAAFSVDLLALSPDTAEVGNPKVIRASAGLVFCLPIERIADPEAFLGLLQSNNVEIYGTDAAASKYVESLGRPQRVCLVIGSEATGLSEFLRSGCQELLAVKTVAAVESLNVAAAAAIAIHVIAGKLGVI